MSEQTDAIVDAALAEYARWVTGSDTRRPAGHMVWVGRLKDDGTSEETTSHRHHDEAEQACHVQAMTAAVRSALSKAER